VKKYKIIVLWVLVIILCITIYNYGKVKCYRYEDTEGWGYSIKTYQGENLGQNQRYKDGEKYKYDGIIYKFEKNTEPRTISIILIIAASFFLSFKIGKS